MMVSFVLSFFPRDVLDEILNLIESVSEDFPSYSCKMNGGKKSHAYMAHIVESTSNNLLPSVRTLHKFKCNVVSSVWDCWIFLIYETEIALF